MGESRTNEEHGEKGADLQRLLRQSRVLQQQRREKIRYFLIIFLVFGDAAAFTLAQFAGAYLRFDSGLLEWILPPGRSDVRSYAPHFVFGLISYLALAGVQNLYGEERCLHLKGLLPKLLKIAFYWFFIYLFISLVFRINPPISRTYAVVVAGLSLPLVYFTRFAILGACLRRDWIKDLKQKVILVGWSDELENLVRLISKDPHHPYHILGWLRTDEEETAAQSLNVKCLGHYDDVEEVVVSQRPEILILQDVGVGVKAIDWLLNLCGREQVDFKVAGSFYRVFVSALRVQMISGVPVLGIQRLTVKAWYNRIIKRFFDVVGALVGLTLFSPVMLYFAWRVRRESPGPVIYRQVRSGLRGQDFNILKIRSMKLDAEKDGIGWSTKEDPRRLEVGEFIRKYNIDELPQFWNVLKGDLSLVGPRPERPELIEDFKHDIRLYNIRHSVKPGMTGWAQIHGWRGDTSLSERIRHDLYYIENWSLWLDFYIMAKTPFSTTNAA